MSGKYKILCVNHRQQACGVFQFFKRLTKPLIASTRFDVYYIDPGDETEFDYWRDQLNPEIVLYNFYTGATMPWLSPGKIQAQRARFKQCCLFHEVPLDSMGFDLIFHQDPSDTFTNYPKLARPIPTFTALRENNHAVPVIGSFGFGLGGKGFNRLAATVNAQFSAAHLRFNIPYAHFGDRDGQGAHAWARHIRDAITNPNITVEITHDFLDEPQLLDWLHGNDLNAFLYDDNYGRGISGTLDYALAVKRPIAITKSWQFKHVWGIDESFLVENETLSNILARGISVLEKFHEIWGDAAVLKSFECGFIEGLNLDV